MSEYQYYEFRAVDRPLSQEERQELRRYSTRATITSTSFTNEYHWGDFKGDADDWMEHYFDGYLYFANWGTRSLKLRIPNQCADRYFLSDSPWKSSVQHERYENNTVITFDRETEGGGDYWEEEGAQGTGLGSLLTIRTELMVGDARALYLAWLIQVEVILEEEDLEPPVPPGLSALTGAQSDLVDFLTIDIDLVAAAAEASLPLGPSTSNDLIVEEWLKAWPEEQRTQLLIRLISGNEPFLAHNLLQEALSSKPAQIAEGPRRTVSELRELAEKHQKVRKRREREEALQAEVQRQAKAAAERAGYLQSIRGSEEDLWRQAKDSVAKKNASGYAKAVQLLIDLRDLDQSVDKKEFLERLTLFKSSYVTSRNLIEKLESADL